MKKTVKSAAIDSVPVMAGYIVIGLGFGLVLRTKGYGVGWSALMSVCIYAGSMQFVTIDLLAGGASVATAALTALMVNARHLFYGISMVDKYKGAGKKKPYLIFALTDETYSLVCSEKTKFDNEEGRYWYYFFISLFDQCYWVFGSIVGALLGATLPFNTEGVDFALTALFVTVFVGQWIEAEEHSAAMIGVLSSLACLIVFGSDAFLIPAMILITVLLVAARRLKRV